jgi:hypothetical protein
MAAEFLPDQKEFLHPLAIKNFAGVEIALRVRSLHMESEELAAVLAHASQVA